MNFQITYHSKNKPQDINQIRFYLTNLEKEEKSKSKVSKKMNKELKKKITQTMKKIKSKIGSL